MRASYDLYKEVVKITQCLYDDPAVVVGYPQGLCKFLSKFVAERNRKVIVSNVNANAVAYCRLRCRKNRRENRRQLNHTTTVANVTEASRTQHSDAGEARTCVPSVLSQQHR